MTKKSEEVKKIVEEEEKKGIELDESDPLHRKISDAIKTRKESGKKKESFKKKKTSQDVKSPMSSNRNSKKSKKGKKDSVKVIYRPKNPPPDGDNQLEGGSPITNMHIDEPSISALFECK